MRMLPWKLRWRGPRTGRQRRSTRARDEKYRASRWYDSLDFGDPFAMLDEGLGGFALALLAIIAIVIAILFVLPAFILLVEVLIVAFLVLVATLIRVLFRQPWLVDAVGDDGTHLTWKVIGYAKSRRAVEDIASLLGKGVASPTIPDAVIVR